jgi:hypothetical protein
VPEYRSSSPVILPADTSSISSAAPVVIASGGISVVRIVSLSWAMSASS